MLHTARSLVAGTCAALMALALTPSPAQAATPPPSRAVLQAQAEAIVAAGAPGVSVEVRDEHGTWSGVAGAGDITSGAAPSADGLLRMGSITKTFTATIVLQLAAENRVELDAPVADYLPGLLPYAEPITVRHLLQHRSGLFDYKDEVWPDVQTVVDGRFADYSPSELVGIATRRPLGFTPGGPFSYSNTGYIVLGMLIEAVTDREFTTELKHRILRPAGLHHTYLAGAFPFLPHPGMRGYETLDSGEPVDLTTYNMTVAGASGAIVSTSADVNRFYAALLAGDLVPAAQLNEMRQTVPAFGPFGYGLGLAGTTLCGRQIWGHVGGALGYLTYSFTGDDGLRQATITVNRSLTAASAVADAITAMLATEFCGEPPTN